MNQYSSSSLLGPHPHHQHHDDNDARLLLSSPLSNNNNNNISASAAAAATRNPKKRTRASRKAPTTVLITDTTNFRSMVQELTGIPTPPPFSYSYSRRLDNLLPFVQKPFLLSSSNSRLLQHNKNMVDAVTASTTANASSSSSSATANNFHLLTPDLGLPYLLHHHQQPQLSMQIHHYPLDLGFNTATTVPAGEAEFGAKSPATLWQEDIYAGYV